MLHEHERIVLTSPLPDEGLEVGDVGTIVQCVEKFLPAGAVPRAGKEPGTKPQAHPCPDRGCRGSIYPRTVH